MGEFEVYLGKIRKKNGEDYLEKSITFYVNFIEKYEHELIPLHDKPEEMVDHMNSLIKKHNHQNYRSALKHYLEFIGMEEQVVHLEKAQKRASALTSERHLADKVMTERDIQYLFDKVEDPEFNLIMRMLYDTACRESELLSMRWRDIEIRFDGKIGAEVHVIGKGGKRRSLFLSNDTTKALLELKSHLDDNEKIFVFKKQGGELYKRQDKYLYDRICKYTKDLLGKKYSVHAYRHTKATHLCEKTDVLGVSAYLSHSSLSTTQIYVKASGKFGKKAFLEGEE